MPFIDIADINDSRLTPYCNLRHNQHDLSQAGLLVAEGHWLAVRLLQSEFKIHSVLVEERRRDDVGEHAAPDVPIYVIPNKAASKIVGFDFHRGVLACGYRPPADERTTAFDKIDQIDKARHSLVVAACGIQDPENLGVVIRNCSAFGVNALIVGPRCIDPFARRVLRVSMGNAFFVPIITTASLEATLAELTDDGFDVAATVLNDDAEPLGTAKCADRQVLVFGEEAHGISPNCLETCTRQLTLLMKNETDSLNVGVASGVFLYHMTHVNR